MQAHPTRLVGQPDQPVIQPDRFRRHRGGEQALQGRAVKCELRCAHLLPVPLAHGMRPEERPIPLAAELHSWRHIRNRCQIDAKTL